MKEILSVFLILAICLTFTGCNNRKETAITTISPLSNDEKEIMRTEELNSIQGRVTGIPYSNVLELRSDIPGWENIWGKKVYIITDRAADSRLSNGAEAKSSNVNNKREPTALFYYFIFQQTR